ncbi:terminase small subunit [Eubacterium barkeri]|uniref:Phage terminase small subunit n=1 Tax=Eubacterium barkeri TaxID=1528 RepID=A0A1H3HDL4_EUBBA|nr:terminase small subunit [Eubacterium barkeri]SDY13557.1 phage terminase small subunit [Eubacterium barkeri]
MTEKQKRFCDEYLVDLNGTRAYKAAYPNVKKDMTAAVNASKMLRNAKVKAYIDRRLEEIRTAKTAEAQEVMEYLTSVMRGESRSEIVVVEGIGDGCSSASRMEKAPDEKERLKAAELLGKRWSLFTDRVDVSGSLDTQTSKLDNLIEQMRRAPDGG